MNCQDVLILMLLNNLKDLLMFFDNANQIMIRFKPQTDNDKVQNANQISMFKGHMSLSSTSYDLEDAIDELPIKCNNMRSVGLPCDLQKITGKKLARASPHI